MTKVLASIRGRFDRAGIFLSGLCAVHCLLGIALVSGLGMGGTFLLAPEIHRVGLAIAIVIGALSLGVGIYRHGSAVPLLAGTAGLGLMALALATGHSMAEPILTVAGVALVAAAHWQNLRRAH